MNVTRFEEAPEYHPANHYNMRCLLLQGHAAARSDRIWLGASVIEPGGHIARSASDLEKIYVVLEGEIELTTDRERVVLQRLDSCRLAPGEARMIRNAGGETAVVMLTMPTAD